MEHRDFPGSRGCWCSLLPLGFVADGQPCKHDVYPHVCGLFWADCSLLPPEASAQRIGGQRSDSNEPQFVHMLGKDKMMWVGSYLGWAGGSKTEKSLCFSNFPRGVWSPFVITHFLKQYLMNSHLWRKHSALGKLSSLIPRGEERLVASQFKWGYLGTALVIQWLRIRLTKQGGEGSIAGWGTKIPHAPTKTWCSQI